MNNVGMLYIKFNLSSTKCMYIQSPAARQLHIQGCQMVSFRTKNPNLGKFWRALDGKMFIYFRAFWNILWTLGIFYYHLVLFGFIWYVFLVLVSGAKKNLATLLDTLTIEQARNPLRNAWIANEFLFSGILICSSLKHRNLK
jgi:hypothetical protein